MVYALTAKVYDLPAICFAILITNTKNDKAVGLAYPIASRINNDTTMAIGDENDKFGGIGRNGAQKMESGEVDIIQTKRCCATLGKIHFLSRQVLQSAWRLFH